jgi:predicted small lipoprotein YifL
MAHRPLTYALSFALAALLGSLAACGEQPLGAPPPEPEDIPHDVELTVDSEELEEVFVREDTRLVSPPVELEEGADQVGVMLTQKGREDPMQVWVRGRDGESVGPWQAVEWTFHEGDRLAGRSALDGVYLAVEVAVPEGEGGDVAALTFAPAVMSDPADEPEIALEAESTDESALHPALAYVGVLPRSAWTTRAPRCSTQEPGGNYHRVALHHGGARASANVEQWLRQAQAYHMDGRNYCDIAYHFGVAIDGRVFELRPQPFRGGHTRNNNSGNIGVLFIGCFHPTCGNDPVSSELKGAGAGLLTMLNLLHDIPINSDKVRGHRDHSYASTACPGDGLYAQLGAIRAMANENLANLNSEPTPPPANDPPPATNPPASCGQLAANSALSANQSVTSCDGRFVFVHQGDGNVVLYKNGQALWSTGTHGQSTNVLVMQGDGNLVLYGPNNVVRWSSGTYGNHGASLAVQNDGNVVLYSTGGTALWHTHTYGH